MTVTSVARVLTIVCRFALAGAATMVLLAAGRTPTSALAAKSRFTTINDPKAGQGNNQGTYPSGINDQGDIVGTYVDSNGNDPGFVFRQG